MPRGWGEAGGEKKQQGKIGLFSKSQGDCIKKKDVSKSSHMMIHGHISQYLVKNEYL